MRYYLILALFLITSACAFNPLRRSVEAENKKIEMFNLKRGMDQNDVKMALGCPHKTETINYDNQLYVVWYFITKGPYLYQTRLINENLSPVVFKDGVLVGWGWNFYNYLFDVNNAKQRKKIFEKNKYTDDRDEWAPNEHKIISPYKKSDQEDKPIEKILEAPPSLPAKPIEQTKEDKEIKKPESTKKDTKPKEKDKPKSPCENRSKEENYNWWE